MSRFRLRLRYCGTQFHGWQVQPRARTVEGELQAALGRLTRGPVETAGASRTDRGVHAEGQCALAVLDTSLDAERLACALDSITPPDIEVAECRPAASGFHPREDVLEKRYLYRLFTGRKRVLHGGECAWRLPFSLDLDAMRQAAALLTGTHDFASFQNHSKQERATTVRSVRAIDLLGDAERVQLQVIGDGFLYRMVRNIVGTLVEVGRGAWRPARIADVLGARDRRAAGPSAPARGLFLMEVRYRGEGSAELAAEFFWPR